MGSRTRQQSDGIEPILDRIGAAVPGVLFCYERTADGAHRAPYISEGVVDVFGLDPGPLQRDVLPLLAMIHADDRSRLDAAIDDAAHRGEPWDVEMRIHVRSGEVRWFGGRASPEFLADGGVRWHGHLLDIHRYKELEATLRANEAERAYQESFQRLIARLSTDLIATGFRDLDVAVDHLLRGIGEFFEVDRAYLYEFVDGMTAVSNTHEWCRQGVPSLIADEVHVPLEPYGWWREQMDALVGADQVLFIPDVSALPPEAAGEAERLAGQGVCSMFCVPVHLDGAVAGFFGVDSLRPRSWREDQMDLLAIVSNLLSGALERHRLEHELLDLTVRDALTGLHNRRYLLPRLAEMCEGAARRQVPFTVAMIDLDHFKDVNDSHGHVVGDVVLDQFADLLTACTRSTDVVCRFGGEEFVVAFPSTTLEQALSVVERLLARCRAETYVVDGLEVALTVSAGVVGGSEVDSERCDADAVLAVADHRLYLAKQRGRDRVVASGRAGQG